MSTLRATPTGLRTLFLPIALIVSIIPFHGAFSASEPAPRDPASTMDAIVTEAQSELEDIEHPGDAVTLLSGLARLRANQGNRIEAHRLLWQAQQRAWGRNDASDNISILAAIAGLEAELGLPNEAITTLRSAEDIVRDERARVREAEASYLQSIIAYAKAQLGDLGGARELLDPKLLQADSVFVQIAIARQQAKKGNFGEAVRFLADAEKLMVSLDSAAQEYATKSAQEVHLQFAVPTNVASSKYASNRLAALIIIRELHAANNTDELRARFSELMTKEPVQKWKAEELAELMKIAHLIGDTLVTQQSATAVKRKIAALKNTGEATGLYTKIAAAFATIGDFGGARAVIRKIDKNERVYAYIQVVEAISERAKRSVVQSHIANQGAIAYLRDSDQGYEIFLRDLATMRETVVPSATGFIVLAPEQQRLNERVRILDAVPGRKGLLLAVGFRLMTLDIATGGLSENKELNLAAPIVIEAKYSPDGGTLAVLGNTPEGVRILSLHTATTTKKMLDFGEAEVDGLIWSPTGKSLVYVENGRRLMALDIATGAARVLTERDSDEHIRLVSPTFGQYEKDVYIFEVVNGMGAPSRLIRIGRKDDAPVLFEDALAMFENLSFLRSHIRKTFIWGRLALGEAHAGSSCLMLGLDDKETPLVIGWNGWTCSSPVFLPPSGMP